MANWLRLEDIPAYRVSSELGDLVWETVISWDSFPKNTVGGQWVRAIDSIAANIAEGFGRYHKKDKEKFFYNARGSVFESAHWAKKSLKRGLISGKQAEIILEKLRTLPHYINTLIKYTEEKLKK